MSLLSGENSDKLIVVVRALTVVVVLTVVMGFALTVVAVFSPTVVTCFLGITATVVGTVLPVTDDDVVAVVSLLPAFQK